MKTALKTHSKLSMDEVWYLYSENLRMVEEQIHEDLKSDIPLIDTISTYIFKSGGKRFRPLLLILTSQLTGYKGNAQKELASVIELIHTATLLHDDVLDEAHVRRSNKTARMLWGNQASILVGDYLYTKAQCRIVSFRNHEINEAVADATRRMTKGELTQLQFHSDLSITEKDYLDIIGNKTAALISTACRIGAILGTGSQEQKAMIEAFGWNIGMAFQVADDTLDYVADKNKLGKTIGKDLQEGKITLPLLSLLRKCSKDEVSVIEKVIRLSDFSKEYLDFILKLMHKYDVINYSFNTARVYVEEAKKSLRLFDDSPHLQALFTVADYVVDRES